MSLRHLKSTVTASCLVAAAALSAASASTLKSGLALPEMTQTTTQATELAFRASGRINDDDHVAYRASGRFNSGVFGHTLLSYRASERGLDTLAYRASGRFDGGFWGPTVLSETLGQDQQTVAYRASGRFYGGFERQMISYRGSERGLESFA